MSNTHGNPQARCLAGTAFQLRQVALRDGRSLSETLRRLVERGMMTVAPSNMPDAVVDKIERGAGKAPWLRSFAGSP